MVELVTEFEERVSGKAIFQTLKTRTIICREVSAKMKTTRLIINIQVTGFFFTTRKINYTPVNKLF